MILVKISGSLRSRFMLVTISGTDYSGKTTLARNLQSMLRESGIPAYYRWFRIGSSPFLETLKAPLKRGTRNGTQEPSGPVKLSDRVLNKGSFLQHVWVVILMLDVLVRTWLQCTLARVRGGVFIVDRFSTDHLVDLLSDYDPAGGWLRFVKSCVEKFPRPSLSLWLVGDEASISSRAKDRADRDLALSRIQLYNRLQITPEGRLNCSLPALELASLACTRVVKEYFA